MNVLNIDPSVVNAALESALRNHREQLGPEETGYVIEAGGGIAGVDGLPGAMAAEMVEFPGGQPGMVMNLERDRVSVVVLGDPAAVHQGDVVRRTCRVLETAVGEALLGRIVGPLGRPLDGKGPVRTSETRRIESDAPGISEREPVSVPLQTGLKSVDALTAIGRGQRELIIGDRQTGKTTVAIDAILNQEPGDVVCIYVAIGQKMSNVTATAELFRERGVLGNVIIVAATAGDSSPLQFIAPFAGCAMAEYFRDRGRDVLIVYDDLSKHAVAYRELSLLLRRPPGREAYPGDIFYLHSRLLERAGRVTSALGGGSITALPIAETQQGDYSAYIPTNLVSITDGQIYLDGDLFHEGFRPAVNVGLSVSRVGGKAQIGAIRKVAIQLRMELAQYREVASFAELTSDLDKATMQQLRRGRRLAELLKQPPHEPMPVAAQASVFWAAGKGYLDGIAVEDVARFQSEWVQLVAVGYPGFADGMKATGRLGPEMAAMLEAAMQQFQRVFAPSAGAKGKGKST
ncbi:MAG: F0F1 ATP synthase subunit alpha [Lentisphaerae bacterium]|nr:F0F1 ATP synthase subunit alpha [Lentisphaerota bacterium]